VLCVLPEGVGELTVTVFYLITFRRAHIQIC
jgi:hypothetical protein